MNQRAYLSGPMRGLPELNHAAFVDAAERLRKHGQYDVVSPVEYDGMPWYDQDDVAAPPLDVQMWDLEQASTCDMIILLPGWEDSEGATAEVAAALWNKVPCYTYHERGVDQYMLKVVQPTINWEAPAVYPKDPTVGRRPSPPSPPVLPDADTKQKTFTFATTAVPDTSSKTRPSSWTSKERLTDTPVIRTFETGATRDTDEGKYDFEGFLSPEVLYAFAAYMHKHRLQKDGTLRDGDNWQKGMPRQECMKSLLRHIIDLWSIERGVLVKRPETGELVSIDDALGGALFNLQIMWLETLQGENRG